MQENDLQQAPNGGTSEREFIVPKNRLSDRYIRFRPQFPPSLPQAASESEAKRFVRLDAGELDTAHTSILRRVRTTLIGVPIPTEAALQERISKVKALAILSSDALSSVAYGTEASLAVLVTAGVATIQHNISIGIGIVILLAIVVFSYRQTIFHYPNGGGSYIVAKENLNVHFGLIAAAALLIDYVLTVSVSVSSGVDALVTAFGGLSPYAVEIGVGLIAVIMFVNLRGVRESGTIFAAPTYIFVGSFILMEIVGLVHAQTHGGILQAIPPNPKGTDIPFSDHLSIFLILTAFTSGCSAMTGVEAISNGVPVFRPPQEKNAAATLTWMAALLAIMYSGTTFLAWRYGILPNAASNPTVIGQLAATFFSGGFRWFYYVFQFATTAILVLAANTSYADFPRLASILARDDFLPHIFSMQGDRLAFNSGIIVLAVLSSLLLVGFHGRTDALINLYALGVFAAFTMSQAGMVRRWLRTREAGWHYGLAINLFGAVTTAVVTIVIGIAKFDRGAWIVVILIPLLYLMFQGICRHYTHVRTVTDAMPVLPPGAGRHLVVVPVARLDHLALRGLSYARRLSPYVIGVHVAMSPEDEAKMHSDWDMLLKNRAFLRGGPGREDWDEQPREQGSDSSLIELVAGPELVVIDSPYRALARPVINFIDTLQRTYPEDLITVVLPEFVTAHFWESLLHNQTALLLKLNLLSRSRIVTANVPYRLTVQAKDSPKSA